MNSNFSSLALRSIEERLAKGSGLQVFDLGRASGSNIDFYSKFSKNIYIEDLLSTVVQERGTQPINARNLFARLTSVPPNAKFDLICCWDIINYLAAEEIVEVGNFLGHFSHENTLLFMLVHMHAAMPEKPASYKIESEQGRIYVSAEEKQVPCPAYSKRFLDQHLPCFKRSRSVLLRNGMEEQIYHGTPRASAPLLLGSDSANAPT
jgi:hypothetical protein